MVKNRSRLIKHTIYEKALCNSLNLLLKKFSSSVMIFLLIFLIVNVNNISYADLEYANLQYADLEDNEQVDLNEIQTELQNETKNIIQSETQGDSQNGTQENSQNVAIETSSNSIEIPKQNARIGLIFDRNSKTILYEKNGLKQVPMASTTKIMTAIVVLENANLKDVVTIEKKAAGTGGSRLGLKLNDKITVHDLLYGLLLESGNDAAVALSIHIGGSVEGFSDLMNAKAKELGLLNSHFTSPHGLDQEGHYTTAYELACMADYALNIPKFKEIVSTKYYTVTINGSSKQISNTNELLGNLDGVYGVKTGFTNGAGRCLVTACKRGNLDIITVVLGSDTKKIRTSDSIKLIEYAYKNYEVINLEEKVKEQFEKWKQLNEKRIYINKGKSNYVSIYMSELKCKQIALRKDKIDNIKIEINSLYYLEAPVKAGQVIGNVKVMNGDETIEVLDITVQKDIAKKEVIDYFIDFLSLVP